ncbi:bidirectional sugar transporter SWEET14-like isoform X2 [Dendrobium catenatum]|uniref:bidirectional sugar transporter SWEET14-like isoform X2 n=1 Tax=Dendrobium catenatum TaxID=906689 RepID=UPI0010A08895|nr:bidirectional sugar transporter SWEET14-like isoform X2 [Dendrobium catenatum]
MLWLYYAFIKTNELLLIIVNSIGCIIEIFYITIFLIFAARKARIYTAKLILILIVGVFPMIVLITLLLFRGSSRLQVLGWICVAFAVCVFAAPLSSMLPNILGVTFGFVQLLLYFIYRGKEEVHKDRRADKVGPEVDINMIVEECFSDKKQGHNSSELRAEQIV